MSLVHNMRQNEQWQGLSDLCVYIKNKLPSSNLNIIEIGSYCGASTEIFATHFPNSTINSVDPWEMYVEDCSTYDLNQQALELKEAEQIFDKLILKYPNIIKNKTSSVEFSKTIKEETVDFIYIDGNHQYSSVIEDLRTWYPKIKKGGMMCGHDGSWESVGKALLEFFNYKSPIAYFMDSSWIYLK